MTGLPDTVNVLLFMPTLVTPVATALTRMLPVFPVNVIPVPAVNLVTPVFVTVIVPLLVIGPPATLIPAPGLIPTLVTVPDTVLLLALVILPN